MKNNRTQLLQKAKNEVFDLVIIGGGITGAGIALKAAQEGWKTLLIDKGDFSSGTSSRSTKLIHGGLRYLSQRNLKLVRETLAERERLLVSYPHLVKPRAFFMPVRGLFKLFKYFIGLSIYDFLSDKSSLPGKRYRFYTNVRKEFPELKSAKLPGGFVFYDAQANDARLTNEVIQQASEMGVVTINYFEVRRFYKEDGVINSIECVDKIEENEEEDDPENVEIRGKVFISATGVWTTEVLRQFNRRDKKIYMAPSKGVHVVVSSEKLPKDCVLLLDSHNEDGRVIWSIPWEEGFQILGTTDTEYYRYLDKVLTEKDEIDYILESVNKGVKGISLTHKDVLGVYAGLRPLNYERGRKEQSNKLSRDYKVWWQGENMLAISGGKLTSFLSMAERTIEKIKERAATIGIQKIDIVTTKAPKKDSQKASRKLVDLFKDRYGLLNATRIALLIQEDESRASKIDDINYSIAEIIFFIRYQSAIRIGDILTRRTMITHTMKKWNSNLIRDIIKIMKTELDWDYEKIVAETKAYRYEWRTMHTWK